MSRRSTSLTCRLACLGWAILALNALLAADLEAPPYRIQAGETLNIQVQGHPEWSLQVSVRPDGMITYPGLGEVRVSGMTISELTEHLVHALGPGGRHLKDPQVFINVTSLRPAVVYVMGAVARPGVVELATGVETAKKVLTLVGGAQPQANLQEVSLYRGDNPAETINLQDQLEGRSKDTVLVGGDVLVVPDVERFVGVLGAAGRVGQIPLKPGQQSIDLLDLVLELGGISPTADKERALILRVDGAVEAIPIDSILKREAPAVQLAAGDVLWVLPEAETEYFVVTGAVNAPGRFEHREGVTLADALALAGQPSEAAETKTVTIVHKDGTKELVNIRPMLEGTDTETARLAVQPEDIILVPVQHESYAILGAIGKPGIAPWEENLRLAEALTRAGGPVERVADMSHLALVRRPEGASNPIIVELNARDLLLGKNESANLVLLPGDTIYIPSVKEKSLQDRLSTPLFLLGLISTLTNIFD